MPQRHLLVVDDEIHIVSILKRRFESAGWRVTVARNGREGVDAALAEVPDVVVVDYQMPEMDGLETAEAFSREGSLRGVPILMLTARGHLVEEARLGATGVREVLQKPFSARDLIRRVEELVPGAGEAGVAA